jgi:hypothetical protein
MKPNTPGPKYFPKLPNHFSFYKFLRCLQLQYLSNWRLIPNILSLVLFICSTLTLSGQLPECEAVPIPNEVESEFGVPDCTLANYDEICIRIKIHYLNNTNEPSNAPGDHYFFQLLKRINNELRPGKIRLSFDYNCIHRGNLTEVLVENTDLSDLINSEDPEESHPEVEYDGEAVNLYFLQEPASSVFFGSYTGRHAVVPIYNYEVIVHELGHTLGLAHTFHGDGLLGDPVIDKTNYCKDLAATFSDNMTLLCDVVADGLCDTGTDPWTLSLDGDGNQDRAKWVDLNTCTQSLDLVPSIEDGCEDITTSWDIPINNFMSYYYQCRTEFSPCQFGKMHEAIELKPELKLDCEEDPFLIELCTASDIVINEIVHWNNQTIYLCPGQKIIITANGHLVLNNTTLTRAEQEFPIEACPDLFYELLWDGIYIKGRGANVLDNGTYYHLGGLTVKNSSVIEFSKYGVQGLQGYGKVEVINSIFRSNMRQFALRDPWPFSFALEGVPSSFTNGSGLCNYSIFNPDPSLILTNTIIEVGSNSLSIEPPAPTQIMVDFGKTTITNCEISNPNEVSSSSDITAIKHARGKLTILNGTKIDNFNTGIVKAADIYNNCSGRGLYIQNSMVTNTMTALHTTTQFVYANYNVFKGNILSEGLCYSHWFANNIRKGIPTSPTMESGHFTIQAAEESYVLKENLFNYIGLDLYGNNGNTNSLCNTWQSMDGGYAVVGEVVNLQVVNLPESWGTFEHSAGNRHLDGEDLPAMFSEDPIINYYDPTEVVEEFDFVDPFLGTEAGEAECLYELYPESSILFDSLFSPISINNSANNSSWLYLDSIKTLKESQIPGSPLTKQKTLLEEIGQIEILQGDLVRSVLSNITSADESIETTWLSRAEPGLIEYSELLALWYKRDFFRLDSMLSPLSDPDAETFLTAVEFVEICSQRNLAIDSLPSSELDTLTEIAQLTFGNYSNILRNYLNMVYDKPITWPVVENGLIPRSSQKERPIKAKETVRNFIVSPNPNNGCFTIKVNDFDWNTAIYQIVSPTGSLIQSGLVLAPDRICLDADASGLYYIRIITLDGNQIETHKILIQ